MSGGGSSSWVSIPSNMKKMIQNIKEITGNHSEDEIYAMLKECAMDPNETTQRLILQDPFHEVKRKRDRRKENVNNREPTESRGRPGSQGRGSRGGRTNFYPRYLSHDAGGGKNSIAGRDNGTCQVAEKDAVLSLPASLETKNKETTPAASSVTVTANGPSGVASGSNCVVNGSNLHASSGGSQPEVSSSAVGINKLGSASSIVDATKIPTLAFGPGPTQGQPAASSSTSSSSTVCFSSLDPVLVPSNEPRLPGAVGTIECEVGSHQTPSEPIACDIGSSFMHGKIPSKSQGVVEAQVTESSLSQPSSVPIHNVFSVCRPPSNYRSHSQEIVGSHKVGSNKEWKPKPKNSNTAQVSGVAASSEVPTVLVEATALSHPVFGSLDSEEAASKLQKKLGDLHLPCQHVIIPNHIHVPESERTKLSFGSFDASFGVASNYVGGRESVSENSQVIEETAPVSETSQVIEETVEEQAAGNQNTLTTSEVSDYPDHPQSPTHVPENLSGEGNVLASAVPEYIESKQETALLSGGQKYSMVHTFPNYSFGFVPAVLGSQFAFENSDSQARDVSRLPGFVVQQPFDPASYYAQLYRSGADGDGRVSPFTSLGVATKYNGNVAVLPPETSQSPQECGNSLVLSTTGPTPLVTQAAGLIQSSLAVTQQPVPVFRPPTGMHISHFPPSYIPYAPYFSPFYVPPPAIHQILSNDAFPQQSQACSMYPPPQAAAAAGAKFSLPQYKPGTHTGNLANIGVPSGYVSYGSSPAGYTPSSAAAAENSTANEDLGASQFKESNVYMTGQQSEGSGMWIAPGREISSLPASSFYNLPPQGQHVTFAPTQAAHGTFAGIYHPSQAGTAATVHPLLQQSQTMAGAVEMGGPAASVYQQTQHAQINWPSNY